MVQKAGCWRELRNAGIGLILCLSIIAAIAIPAPGHAEEASILGIPALYLFYRCLALGDRLIELGRKQADVAKKAPPAVRPQDPGIELSVLEGNAAATMIRRQAHWSNIRQAGTHLAICLLASGILSYCLYYRTISPMFGLLFLVLGPYTLGSFIRLCSEASHFIRLSHALLSQERNVLIPEPPPIVPATAPRMPQPLTLEEDPSYPPLLLRKRQCLKDLIFAASITGGIIAAAQIIERFGPARTGDHPPNLFLYFGFLSPFWLVPLLLRYEVAWRKVSEMHFLYHWVTACPELPPQISLQTGLRRLHLRTILISGAFVTCGVTGLFFLLPSTWGLFPDTVPTWLIFPFSAFAFFGLWALIDAALALRRVTLASPPISQTADEILRRELPRIHLLSIADLVQSRGMKAFAYLIVLTAFSALLYLR